MAWHWVILDSSVLINLVVETASLKNWQTLFLSDDTLVVLFCQQSHVSHQFHVDSFFFISFTSLWSACICYCFCIKFNRMYASSIWKIRYMLEELRDQIRKWMYIPLFFGFFNVITYFHCNLTNITHFSEGICYSLKLLTLTHCHYGKF